jgi:hypothetical protein
MALAAMDWNKISIHNVVSEFLRAERDKNFSFYPPWLPIIDNPNLNDPLENHKRLRLLYLKRLIFMVEIPPDTLWYEVQTLTENEMDELYVSAHHNSQWDQVGNKLDRVAAAAPEPLTAPPNAWGRLVLWGHTKAGPFSILEGNHRLIGYAGANSPPPLNITVYVGLSPSHCFWHYADPFLSLGQGLFNVSTPIQIVPQNDWLLAWISTEADSPNI